ncbi:YcnI family copper-binding membrane protein [Roseateles violae]|uniref:YcnI family protein n=1 Tax=Roseateles violae TaxID=3058042 RepID=A0ABT8DYS8_9BURK|nr:YcnI family protein [Pelomonas sp. PFR6]MDN3922733.1 YcnI family protein [Pelomonas sp. PFR6]
MKHKKPSLIAALLVLAGSARAHIVLEQPSAEAGSAYKAVFKVGHGCEGSATRHITVRLPEGFRGAKPVPKPGWTLSLRMAPLAQPYESHGRRIEQDLAEVTWTANSEADQLQDAWYDEFQLRGTLPEQPGELWFKLRQVCAQGETDWAEIPAAGASSKGLKAPAARLNVTARTAEAGHAH